MRLDRQFLDDLAVKPEAQRLASGRAEAEAGHNDRRRDPGGNSAGQTRDPASSAQSTSSGSIGQTAGSRFGNPQDAGFEIEARIQDLEQPHELPLPIDPGKSDSLACLQGVDEKRPGLELFGESLRVKQDGTCFGITGKLGKEPDKSSLLGRSFVQDQGPGSATWRNAAALS